MKIIDLFTKMANGEEVPKKIKYKGYVFVYVDEFYGYMKENYLTAANDEVISFTGKIVSMEELNDEVIILDSITNTKDIKVTNNDGFQTLANVFYKGIEQVQRDSQK